MLMKNSYLIGTLLAATVAANSYAAEQHPYFSPGKVWVWTYVTISEEGRTESLARFTVDGNDGANTPEEIHTITVSFDDNLFEPYTMQVKEEDGLLSVGEGDNSLYLYDFGVSEGDSVDFIYDGHSSDTYIVSDIYNVNIHGITRRFLKLKDTESEHVVTWVDGIGSYSCGDFISIFPVPTGGEGYSFWGHFVECHEDGQLVFTAEDFNRKPCVKTVREDRVWIYTGQKEDCNIFYYAEFQPAFAVGGKEYHKFVFTKAKKHTAPGSMEEYVEYPVNTILYYLREEGGKIYELTADGWMATGPINETEDTVYDEVEIYDWNLADGAVWSHTPFRKSSGGTDESFRPRINYGEYINVGGTDCKTFSLSEIPDGIHDDILFIEGVGPVKWGTIGDVNPWILTEGGFTTSFDRLHLSAVTTKGGEILYGWPPSSVDLVFDAESRIEGVVYDLHGNRVDSPQPGSVYIRDGRKFVPSR